MVPVIALRVQYNCQHSTPAELAVKQSGADVMGTYMTFEPDQGIFAKQLRQLGVTLTWVGSPTTVTTTALKLAGPALYGSYAVVDFNKDSSAAARAFAAKYEAAYKSAPDIFWSWPTMPYSCLRAIGEAKNRNPALSDSAVKGFPAPGLQIRPERRRAPRHNIVKGCFQPGTVVFDKHVDFD
jgi:branched-chain amino acid transport system substrate-binding protein